MNAVEIEDAVSQLAEAPFDAGTFPFAFLEAFGNKETTIKRLQSGTTNQSDVPGGVLQRNHIHIKACPQGSVTATLTALRNSPTTARLKCTFILATDGVGFEAENIDDGETIACAYKDFHDHFGFFLPLAGITTVKQIRDNAFDIKATSRLNKLYLELLKTNPNWSTADRREELNHFMARLIFSFFAEDTGIFHPKGSFTKTIEQMSAHDSVNTHEVLSEVFRAMNTKPEDRETAKIKSWANPFPYVNGGLFSGSAEVPRFSRIARSFLLHVGNLDWTKINPDIFGSMIQAVADDDERGTLGMHYTSVPNILKVLNPLFLDDLRKKIAEAGDNPRKLLNLRERIARIRVFDPACGSGNFLVIAYKHLREIEAEINRRRNENQRRSEIPLTNFRGIEIRHFSCEIARLALVIAEYQCDVLHLSWTLANAEFLPLEKANWITCGNALQIDWLRVCPPTGSNDKVKNENEFVTPTNHIDMNFKNEGGNTYICGNPPYVGDKRQSESQKDDMEKIFGKLTSRWKSFDYIGAFIYKAANYIFQVEGSSAGIVSTNSISQGMQVAQFWPLVFKNAKIGFAELSFKWTNLAANNAGVMCVIIGITNKASKDTCWIIEDGAAREVEAISPYLTSGAPIFVAASQRPMAKVSEMMLGNFAKDGGHLLLTHNEAAALDQQAKRFIRPIFGA